MEEEGEEEGEGEEEEEEEGRDCIIVLATPYGGTQHSRIILSCTATDSQKSRKFSPAKETRYTIHELTSTWHSRSIHKIIKSFLVSEQRVPDANHLCRGMKPVTYTPADRSPLMAHQAGESLEREVG